MSRGMSYAEFPNVPANFGDVFVSILNSLERCVGDFVFPSCDGPEYEIEENITIFRYALTRSPRHDRGERTPSGNEVDRLGEAAEESLELTLGYGGRRTRTDVTVRGVEIS